MTIAVAQSTQNSVGNVGALTIANTTPLTVAAGSTLVVFAACGSGGGITVSSASGSVNGAFTQLDDVDGPINGERTASFIKTNCAGGSETVTVTFSSSAATFRAIWFVEITGASTGASTADGHTGQSQTTPTTGTDATTSGNASSAAQPALVLGICQQTNTSSAPTAGTGFTDHGTGWTEGGATAATRLESKRVTATGNQAATFTATANDEHTTLVVVIDEFVPAAATYPRPKGPRRRRRGDEENEFSSAWFIQEQSNPLYWFSDDFSDSVTTFDPAKQPLTWKPDWIERKFLATSQQQAATEVPPKPENLIQLDWSPSYPDRALRASLPVASHDFFETSRQPERTAPMAVEWHPDRVDRARMPAAHHPYFATSPQPERTSPLASEIHPDRVDRPFLSAANQQASSEVSPRPEDRIELDWGPWYPDRASRAFQPVSAHPYFATSQQPERTSPIAVDVHPDRVDRPFFHASQQLGQTGLSPSPITALRTGWDPIYPDRAIRSFPPAAVQPYFTFAPQPERPAPLASEYHPDRADRAFFHASQQLGPTELSPQPERTSPLAVNIQPDRIDRAAAVAQQQAPTGVSPFPLPSLITGWYPNYPERASRAWLPVASHQTIAFDPKPERTSPLASEYHPDRIDRAVFLVASQRGATELSPFPIPTLRTGWDPVYPDRASRAFPPAAGQPYFTFAPQVERTSPLAAEWHPDRVDRPSLHASQQLAATELSPKPERTSPLVSEQHADFAPRRLEQAWLRPYLGSIDPFPRPSQILGWDPVYPDRAPRSTLPAAQHPFLGLGPQPERRSPLAAVWAPDRVDRATFPAADHPFVTGIYPQPERKSPLAAVWAPDRVERAVFPTAQQLAATELPAKPEEPLPDPLRWYPDSVRRAEVPQSRYQALAFDPKPERTRPLAVDVHPDRIDRPAVRAADQYFTDTPVPQEKIIQLGWSATYADYVPTAHNHRPWLEQYQPLLIVAVIPTGPPGIVLLYYRAVTELNLTERPVMTMELTEQPTLQIRLNHKRISSMPSVVGNRHRLAVEFLDINENPVDPDISVTIKVETPTHVITSYVYGIDAVVRTGVGLYYVDINDNNLSGDWLYGGIGLGNNVQATREKGFHVDPSSFTA